ncbi:bifunctional pyr operon transcriptional regulator/uracil phosphoribosyltransferase PyrR [Gemmatimonas aurantiaca]|nr:bifunctional pyr operon transcriptional regulator/uracil phosphoribosyltransferase PyrR [Gemmatimonas aurantiaca]
MFLDAIGLRRALTRIAHEIIERNRGVQDVALVGIITRGATLAKRLQALIEELEGVKVELGLMDINLYRDDATTRLDQPIIQKTDILFNVVDKNIVLVDDVLFTGRTIRAALDQLTDFGRPRSIQLAVLVDRGHRELPIRADYVGKNVPTNRTDRVSALLTEHDDEDGIHIERGLGDGNSSSKSKKSGEESA